MNDFLRMILNRLSDAIPLAIMAVVLCAIGIGVAYLLFKKKYKDTRKFPFAKIFLWLALAGYIAIVLVATVLRGQDCAAVTSTCSERGVRRGISCPLRIGQTCF